ncbi:Bug family tripartite tricarboxylate transporter substrate binding protein [Taylorella equigenitalis]|uniref:Tricarboxylate transport protein TctC n=3 Tax=Taylorella equigenitalis TaxID=29575 RepID=A0A654KG17_TAYEM|nr:tripartite tricarboxylate transporter substrate binding protein [Taylorella equigenitalis]ADU91388.1 Tricarboxylate transport protein TctC [Taylorella equigenitalis MCE9]AFN36476.1 tricarboxylate transport protein TctC [Taylorella equigenitalis ATCC 35865]ASY31042.1 tricarboxylic transporter [Taylorella equigenitalis]ASY38344.1 tricarboxylic transporter [Taylorella equigenitalis]ASY39877.1 tricarboxylic transporter [Taylorella equigenitalis]
MNLSVKLLNSLFVGALAITSLVSVQAADNAEPKRPECVAPAKPGGGFDLTCRVAVNGFAQTKIIDKQIRTVYMPGGVGAVAYNNIISKKADDNNAIVAFSGGSLLNIAQGKFGRYTVDDVRWLATVGTDYGAIIVNKDSKFQNLGDLINALKADPKAVVFAAGATIGGQDWMTAALTAKQAGVDYQNMRFVAFEGGGEAATALQGNHVDVLLSGLAEASTLIDGGAPLRILAVFSDKRMDGRLNNIPTAKEQGYDIQWPVIRGFYLPPKVTDEQFKYWEDKFQALYKTPEFKKIQESQGLFPFEKTGAELDKFVKERSAYYKELADSFGLIKK